MSDGIERGLGSIYVDPIYMSFITVTHRVNTHFDDGYIFGSAEDWNRLREEHRKLIEGVSEFHEVLSRYEPYVTFVTERLARANPAPDSSSKRVLLQASWEQVLRSLRKFTEQMKLITPGRALAMRLVDELIEEMRFTEPQARALPNRDAREFFAQLVRLRDAALQEEDELKALTGMLRFIEDFQRSESYLYMTTQRAIALRESEETPPLDQLMLELEAYCLQLDEV